MAGGTFYGITNGLARHNRIHSLLCLAASPLVAHPGQRPKWPLRYPLGRHRNVVEPPHERHDLAAILWFSIPAIGELLD